MFIQYAIEPFQGSEFVVALQRMYQKFKVKNIIDINNLVVFVLITLW
jgi:hypothetical protein